jgi:hypothetical protein
LNYLYYCYYEAVDQPIESDEEDIDKDNIQEDDALPEDVPSMIEVQTNDSDSEKEFDYSGREVRENKMRWRKSERIRLDKVKNIKISDEIMLSQKKKLFEIFLCFLLRKLWNT